MERVGDASRSLPVGLRLLILSGALLLGFLAPAVPALAQTDESVPTDSVPTGSVAQETTTTAPPERTGIPVATPGRCEGNAASVVDASSVPAIEAGIGIDCEFDLLSDVPEPPDGWSLDDLEVLTPDGEAWPCDVVDEASIVRCGGVGAGSTVAATGELALRWGFERWESVAPYRVGDGAGRTVFLSLYDSEEVTWADAPLRVSAWPTGEVEALWAVVRPRWSDEVVARLPMTVARDDQGITGDNELVLDLPPGRYRLWPCVGDTAETCVEEVGGYPVQVIDGSLRELVVGFNRPSAERINIVFVGAGLDDRLEEIATLMLGLGGPIAIDLDGQPTDDPNAVVDLRYGPMAIEPLASSRDRFNFWYLSDDLADELALVHEAGFEDRLAAFGLDHVQVTALYDQRLGTWSDARATSFWGELEVPDLGGLAFGGARVSIDADAPLWSAETLAHEWGHGLFELRDEYYGFDGRPIAHGAPNCAVDEIEARLWWGADLGEVDPFVERVRDDRISYGLDADPYGASLADAVRVTPTEGGCYGDYGAGGAWRPSEDSLMNSEIPVFGTVNRARVAAVLERFSGRGTVRTLGDVTTMACVEVMVGTVTGVECEGSVLSHLDLVDGDVKLGTRSCQALTDAEAAERGLPVDSPIVPARFTCAAPMPYGGWATLGVGSSRARVQIELLPDVDARVALASAAAPHTQPTVPTPAVVRAPSPAEGTGGAVAAGGVLALVSAAVIVTTRRRSA